MKNSYYFPHDMDATDDIKVQGFLSEFGAAGYGIYWRIIEMLHKEENNKLPFKKYSYLAIAKQMLVDAAQVEEMVKSLINEYDLLISDDNFFWSNRVLRNIDNIKSISLKRREAGRLGAIAKQEQAIAKQNVANKSKINKSKGKKDDSSANADFETLGLFKMFKDEYNKFLKQQIDVEENFTVAGQVALKKIILYLIENVKKINSNSGKEQPKEEIEKRALDGWVYILSNFNKWDNFFQKQIKIEQIYSNIVNILASIKNGTAKPKGTAKTGNDIIAEQLAAKYGGNNSHG